MGKLLTQTLLLALAADVFKAHPGVDTFHATPDGQFFEQPVYANEHAERLTKSEDLEDAIEVKVFTRKEVEATVAQAEKPAAAPKAPKAPKTPAAPKAPKTPAIVPPAPETEPKTDEETAK